MIHASRTTYRRAGSMLLASPLRARCNIAAPALIIAHQNRLLSADGDPASRLKSSNDSSPDRARPNDNTDFISEHHVDPIRALFPWRHSPSPLPRLCPGTPEYSSQGGYIGPGMPPLNRWIRGALFWNAASMLNIPSYKVLFFRGWEEEMASQFSWAFQMAVAGLLSRTYRVPMESIISTESPTDASDKEATVDDDAESDEPSPPVESSSFVVNFDQTVAPPPHPTDITEPKPTNHHDDFDDENAPELEFMLQKQLRTLYEMAHEHTRHNLQIRLKTEPYDAEIVSMFLIPFITRERVEATPALRHALRNVWVHLEEKEEKLGRRLGMGEAISEIAGQLESLAKKQADSQGVVQSTIICQTLIKCREIFAVTNELDQVVQGDPEGKVNDVTHLVRFEMTISASINGGPSTLGSWQITDIDDLLEGNVWYT